NVAPDPTVGPLPYDQSWSFNHDNSLTSFTETATGARAATYTYGSTTHAASSVAVTGTGPGTTGLTYDASGYLQQRTTPTWTETLVWGNLHQLASSTDAGGTTRFAYDHEGSCLIRAATTETTLTLGSTALVFPATGTATGRR